MLKIKFKKIHLPKQTTVDFASPKKENWTNEKPVRTLLRWHLYVHLC